MGEYKYDVSIIVLSYNQEKFIYETLSSVEAQNFGSVQVIVGDDASTDSTPMILNDFADKSKFDFTLIFHEENLGITKNLNKCLDCVDGKYIMTLGGDDLFVAGKVFEQFFHMEKDPECIISFHDTYVFRDNINNVLCNYSEMYPCVPLTLDSLIKYGTFFTGSSFCVRNFDGLPKCNQDILHASDWLWYMEILMKSGGVISRLPGVFAYYRRHENNITSFGNIDSACHDTIFTLNYIKAHYFNHTLVNNSLSERLFAFSLKYLISRNYRKCFDHFKKSLSYSIFGVCFFVRYRIGNIFIRFLGYK